MTETTDKPNRAAKLAADLVETMDVQSQWVARHACDKAEVEAFAKLVGRQMRLQNEFTLETKGDVKLMSDLMLAAGIKAMAKAVQADAAKSKDEPQEPKDPLTSFGPDGPPPGYNLI